MIRSFADKETERAFFEGWSRRYGSILSVARRKLQVLDNTRHLYDLREPAGNRLEAWRGDRRGQYSIRINDQYRICFRWIDTEPHDVEIVDYHLKGMSMAILRDDPNRQPPPMHPGEILREEFMEPNGISAHALGLALRVPATRISEIVNERRGITADTACRLAIYFKTTPNLWMSLQSSYELSCIERDAMKQLRREVHTRVA